MDENEKFAQGLIDVAKKGEHSKHETITNWGMYVAAKELRDSMSSIATLFKNEKEDVCDKYLEALKNNVDDVRYLFNYRVLDQCQKYYEEEFVLMAEMVKEYEDYLWSTCSWIRAFLGQERVLENE